jgi:hypothetical protein
MVIVPFLIGNNMMKLLKSEHPPMPRYYSNSDRTTDTTTGASTSHSAMPPKNGGQEAGYSHLTDETTSQSTDTTTSHLTNPAKYTGQIIGYSHPTKQPKDGCQVVGYRASKNNVQVAGYRSNVHFCKAGCSRRIWLSGIARPTIVLLLKWKWNYTHLLGIVAALMLGSCASDFPDIAMPRKVLEPWTDIKGAQTGLSPFGQPAQMNPSGAGYISLVRPAAMSARGNDLYLLDAGLRRIFRYDRGQQTLTPFATSLSAGAGISIYAAPDTSVYVTDPSREQVLHFTWNGTPLPPLISRGNLARPVSVIVDASNGQVLVADGLYDQIIVFNSWGTPLNIIKPQHVLTIAAMAAGPDGIYVVDHLAKQVVVLGWDGRFRYAFGADAMSEPGSIAVSRDNLVFVSDNFEHIIKVYRVQRTGNRSQQAEDGNAPLVAKIGGIGVALGSFNRISGMSVADDFLFVADSLNARVQIMMINPSALDVGK